MPTFLPNEPQNSEIVDADLLRNQFNALNDSITALPVGPAGPQGLPGAPGADGAPGTDADPIVGTITGIVKADGAGTISAAVPGSDFLSPTGDGSGLTGVLTTLAGHNVSELANDAGYYVGDGSAFATTAQGATADNALQPSGDGAALSGVIHTETDPIVGAVNGIVKSDGAGTLSAAVANTDYYTHGVDGTYGEDVTFRGGMDNSGESNSITLFGAGSNSDGTWDEEIHSGFGIRISPALGGSPISINTHNGSVVVPGGVRANLLKGTTLSVDSRNRTLVAADGSEVTLDWVNRYLPGGWTDGGGNPILNSASAIPFADNSAGANWATATPTNTTDAFNRIAAALAGLLGTPIP